MHTVIGTWHLAKDLAGNLIGIREDGGIRFNIQPIDEEPRLRLSQCSRFMPLEQFPPFTPIGCRCTRFGFGLYSQVAMYRRQKRCFFSCLRMFEH